MFKDGQKTWKCESQEYKVSHEAFKSRQVNEIHGNGTEHLFRQHKFIVGYQ